MGFYRIFQKKTVELVKFYENPVMWSWEIILCRGGGRRVFGNGMLVKLKQFQYSTICTDKIVSIKPDNQFLENLRPSSEQCVPFSSSQITMCYMILHTFLAMLVDFKNGV